MNEFNSISRRDFIIAVLAATGVSMFASSYWSSLVMENALDKLNKPITEKNLTNTFSNIENSMKIIGKYYIENSLKSKTLSETDIISEISDQLSEQVLTKDMFFDLKERIKQQVIDDFKKDKFVNIENWMVTITEAQICSIIWLCNK